MRVHANDVTARMKLSHVRPSEEATAVDHARRDQEMTTPAALFETVCDRQRRSASVVESEDEVGAGGRHTAMQQNRNTPRSRHCVEVCVELRPRVLIRQRASALEACRRWIVGDFVIEEREQRGSHSTTSCNSMGAISVRDAEPCDSEGSRTIRGYRTRSPEG